MSRSALILIALAAIFTSGCFYDPDRDQIDLAYEAGPVEETDGGLGELCDADAQCADNSEAKYCAFNPQTPGEPGHCTIANCLPGSCPEGYLCCDCPDFGYDKTICIDEESANLAEKFGYCACD